MTGQDFPDFDDIALPENTEPVKSLAHPMLKLKKITNAITKQLM
ncbi:hypothetical protein MASR1M45_06880 [Candidatus Kapaibacterium sp.]